MKIHCNSHGGSVVGAVVVVVVVVVVVAGSCKIEKNKRN